MPSAILIVSILIDVVFVILIGIMIYLIITGFRSYTTCNETESGGCPALTCVDKSEECGFYAYRSENGKTYCNKQN